MIASLLHILCYIVLYSSDVLCKHSFEDILSHFEILNLKHVKHNIVRRNADLQQHYRHVSFYTHNIYFELKLRQTNEIFSPDFKAVVVRDGGQLNEIEINKNTFYSGYMNDKYESTVLVHIDEDNDVITGVIKTSDETFHIEPLRHHIEQSTTTKTTTINNDMLVYKESDVNSNITNMKTKFHKNMAFSIGSGITKENKEQIKKVKKEEEKRSRRRRSSHDCNGVPSKNLCTLYLVADHLYYENIGGSNERNTIHHMLLAITIADNIFKNTVWDAKIQHGCKVGFIVKEVKVYQTPSNKTGPRFNQKFSGSSMNVNKLLDIFLEDEGRIYDKNICLVHLFTYQDFTGGVVGIAFIASVGGVTGICSDRKVALSSSINYGRRLLTLEANLVTSHELAHNFGARHDADESCIPGKESSDGNYLMFDRVSSGEKKNNNKLSKCSISDISNVLYYLRNMKQVEYSKCFVDQKNAQCGNGIIDKHEDCDTGIFIKDDPCCDKNCKFKDKHIKANCSDINHACCRNCNFYNSSKICRRRNEFDCTDNVFCTGTSGKCPDKGERLEDNSTCNFGRGNCQKDGCVGLCTQNNLKECFCKGKDSCQICCRNNTSSTCELLIIKGEMIKESNGTLCKLVNNEDGLCYKGQCQKIQKNVEDEFTALLKDFTFSKLGRFLKANIVGAILIFSLSVWIPASCIVYYLDKKQDEEDFMISRWMNPHNSQLVPKDNRNRFRDFFKKNAGKAKKVSGGRFHISS